MFGGLDLTLKYAGGDKWVIMCSSKHWPGQLQGDKHPAAFGAVAPQCGKWALAFNLG